MNKNNQNRSIELFRSGHNCAQSVLVALAESLKIDEETASNIALGFGAGMGGSQKTCGAVTGAYMALGLHTGQDNNELADKKVKTNQLVNLFNNEFVSLHKATSCITLLGCDFSTEEGEQEFIQKCLRKTVCEVCIKDAICIVEKLVDEE